MSKTFTGGLNFITGKCKPLEKSKSVKIITPEKNIQASFIAWRNIHKRQFPILNAIFAVPNGVWAQNTAVAIAQIKQGLTPGIPDLICLAPSACGKYHGLLIELKTESSLSRTSDEQKFFLEFFASLNYRTEVCRSASQASMLVNEHLNIKVPIYPR